MVILMCFLILFQESRLQRLREAVTTPPATPVECPPVQQAPQPRQVSPAVQTSPPQQFEREPAVKSNDPVTRLNFFTQQNGLTKPDYTVRKCLSKKKDAAGHNIEVFYASVEVTICSKQFLMNNSKNYSY